MFGRLGRPEVRRFQPHSIPSRQALVGTSSRVRASTCSRTSSPNTHTVASDSSERWRAEKWASSPVRAKTGTARSV